MEEKRRPLDDQAAAELLEIMNKCGQMSPLAPPPDQPPEASDQLQQIMMLLQSATERKDATLDTLRCILDLELLQMQFEPSLAEAELKLHRILTERVLRVVAQDNLADMSVEELRSLLQLVQTLRLRHTTSVVETPHSRDCRDICWRKLSRWQKFLAYINPWHSHHRLHQG